MQPHTKLGFLTLCVVRILDRNFVQDARAGLSWAFVPFLFVLA